MPTNDEMQLVIDLCEGKQRCQFQPGPVFFNRTVNCPAEQYDWISGGSWVDWRCNGSDDQRVQNNFEDQSPEDLEEEEEDLNLEEEE